MSLLETISMRERMSALSSVAGFVRRFPAYFLSILVVALVVIWVVAPALVTVHDPYFVNVANRLKPPSALHWFGTDNVGRDVYTRIVYGAALTMQAAAIAIAFAFSFAFVLGLVSGYFGGWVDEAMMRIVDVMLAVPALLVSLMVVTILGFGTVNVAIAVGIGSIASLTRLMRGETMRVKNAAFVEAARAYGLSVPATIARHIFPHARGPVLSLVALEFGHAILAISALSFLGYGAPPPSPEWGTLVAEGRNFMALAWWPTTFPGLVIVAVVLAVNRLGKGPRGSID